MNKYKIIVSYDGTDYCGWQYQDDVPTVTKTLQDTFTRVFDKQISILGASRTDAGVHAYGQVARFHVDVRLDPQKMRNAWSAVLNPTIMIRSIELITDDFHPQHNVASKTYYYDFFTQRPTPFAQRYGWYQRRSVDFVKLQKCLNVFVGTHDFRSFCSGWDREDTVRTIDEITFQSLPEQGRHRITIKGPSFLRYMIRRIVGACLAVASRDTIDVDCLAKALAERNPEQTLPKAPAKGLLLYEIAYAKEQSELG